MYSKRLLDDSSALHRCAILMPPHERYYNVNRPSSALSLVALAAECFAPCHSGKARRSMVDTRFVLRRKCISSISYSRYRGHCDRCKTCDFANGRKCTPRVCPAPSTRHEHIGKSHIFLVRFCCVLDWPLWPKELTGLISDFTCGYSVWPDVRNTAKMLYIARLGVCSLAQGTVIV
jgi:hypothetical protein